MSLSVFWQWSKLLPWRGISSGVQELHKCFFSSSLLEEVHKIYMDEQHHYLSEWGHEIRHTVSSENFILGPMNMSSSTFVCHMNCYFSAE